MASADDGIRPSSAPSAPSGSGRSGLVGAVVASRYRIERIVSAGAYTVVVDAVDIQLERLVTVKLVRPEISELPEFQRRFDQVMRSMTTLSHLNIAAVHDWGEDRIGGRTTMFAVVEQLGGGSLRDILDRGRLLAPSQALVVGLDACRALDYAHRRNLVHGELTPSKLVFGDDRRLRVIDFGLARLLGSSAWREPTTVEPHVARYASPEQALGQGIDAKSDVYALGLTLIESVTGTVPFSGDSTVATLSARVGKLTPVSADLGALASVLERAGRPDRNDRWTAAEFGRALIRAAENLPRPTPLPLVTSAPPRREPTRRPTDPSGGVDRPPTPAGGIVTAPPAPAPIPLELVHVAPLQFGPDETDDDEDDEDGDDAAGGSDVTVAGPGEITLVVADDDGEASPEASPEAPPETVTERARTRWWVRAVAAFLLAAALAAVAVLAYVLLRTDRHEVPPLTGLTEARARAAVSEFEWDVQIRRERSDEEPDDGQVIRTSPAPGEQLAEGEPFFLVISEGPELRPLPELRDMTLADARQRLQRLRLESSTTAPVYDERVAPGSVVSWSVRDDGSLRAGDGVEPGTEVRLTLSRGPEPRTVPDLRTLSVAQARGRLEELRLRLDVGRLVFSSIIERDLIVRQQPKPGGELEREETVTVFVSKGPDLVVFPDLEGLAFRDAVRRLEESGLQRGGVLGSTQGEFYRATIAGITADPGERFLRNSPVDLVFL